MRSFAVLAAVAGLAAAMPHESVVYSTEEITITSCGPEVTNCPARQSATSVPVAVTSVAPVSSAVTSAPSVPLVTKTVYQTTLLTKTECASTVTNCPAHSTVIYTSVIPAYTTVCPATETPVYTPPAVPASSQPAGVPSSSVAAVGSTETPCSTSQTVTVTVPVSKPTAPASVPVSVPATVPVPGKPSGTGNAPYPSSVAGGVSSGIWGTASSSGVIKPSAYPSQFTGAANPQATIGAIAGVGAIAAFFL